MIDVPQATEFRAGYLAFQEREQRDAMYKTATFLVDHYWGQPARMADSLGVLLLTWNQAFYRYGPFDFQRLEDCLVRNQPVLAGFRARNILSYSAVDDATINPLFTEFLSSLQLSEGTKKGTASPVAVAKALHLLAPSYFPLWDAEIAKQHGCYYSPRPAEKYIAFIRKMKDWAEKLSSSKL